MKARSKLVIAFAALLLILLGVVVMAGRREPSYEGKSLSYWVMKAYEADTNGWLVGELPRRKVPRDVEAAIRSIGTNGIPFYLEWLPHQFPRHVQIQKSLASFSRKFIAHDWQPYLKIQKRSRGSSVAFGILKESAAPAIPRLVFYATNESTSPNLVNQLIAIQCLTEIGAPADAALISLMTNNNASVRDIASSYFKPVRRRRERIADFKILLDDPNPEVRRDATNGLERMGVSPTS